MLAPIVRLLAVVVRSLRRSMDLHVARDERPGRLRADRNDDALTVTPRSRAGIVLPGASMGRAEGLGYFVEMLRGNWAAAEHGLRSGYDSLESMGDKNYLSTAAGCLAHCLHDQRRPPPLRGQRNTVGPPGNEALLSDVTAAAG